MMRRRMFKLVVFLAAVTPLLAQTSSDVLPLVGIAGVTFKVSDLSSVYRELHRFVRVE